MTDLTTISSTIQHHAKRIRWSRIGYTSLAFSGLVLMTTAPFCASLADSLVRLFAGAGIVFVACDCARKSR